MDPAMKDLTEQVASLALLIKNISGNKLDELPDEHNPDDPRSREFVTS